MAVSMMQRDKLDLNRKTLLLATLSSIALSNSPSVNAQGIGEYGGLMGIPRPVPSGHASAVSGLYNAPNLTGGSSSAGGGAGAGMPIVGDSREIAKNVADKANAYFNEAQKKEKAGNAAEAQKLYLTSAAWRERVWGTKDPAVYVIYGKVGSLCMKQGKMAEAEAAFRKQIACSVRLYGAGAYEAVPVLNNLGEAVVAQGKWPDAVGTYRQVYQLKKRKMGDNNSETLGAMLKLCNALKQSGNLKDAESMSKEGATLAQQTPENALLVQAFNEVMNPPASPTGGTPSDAGASANPAAGAAPPASTSTVQPSTSTEPKGLTNPTSSEKESVQKPPK